jgi:hypothetical protein
MVNRLPGEDISNMRATRVRASGIKPRVTGRKPGVRGVARSPGYSMERELNGGGGGRDVGAPRDQPPAAANTEKKRKKPEEKKV